MNDMTPGIGHNGAPDPIELVLAEYDDLLCEVANWTDGEPVTDKASMEAVDALLKQFKTYKSAIVKAGKDRTDPFHKAWKSEVATVKVYTDDADLIQSALVAVVAPFKAKLVEQQRIEQQVAWEAANKAKREAEAKAAQANAADIDAQREAAAAAQAAMDADKAARAQAKAGVKGMRKVTHHEVVDLRGLVNWIATNDKDAIAAFATEYARKSHADIPDAIVRTWTDREAF